MQIHMTTASKKTNITNLVGTVTVSGNYKQSARTLDFEIIHSPTDKNVLLVDVEIGASIVVIEAGETIFDGFVIRRTKNIESNTKSVTCFDRGFYMSNTAGMYKVEEETPEDAAKRICADYAVDVGEIAETGVPLNRNFITGGENLYDIINSLYTLASDITGDKYRAGFTGNKFCVWILEPDENTLVIKGKSNLIGAQVTESMEAMVTQVEIYNDKDELINTYSDDERIEKYGLLRKIIKQNKEDDSTAQAQRIIDEGDIEQKITVDNLGDIRAITGKCVIVKEPFTGLSGLFYIENDTHQWKRGVYYNKLALNFKAMMDESTAGSENKEE